MTLTWVFLVAARTRTRRTGREERRPVTIIWNTKQDDDNDVVHHQRRRHYQHHRANYEINNHREVL